MHPHKKLLLAELVAALVVCTTASVPLTGMVTQTHRARPTVTTVETSHTKKPVKSVAKGQKTTKNNRVMLQVQRTKIVGRAVPQLLAFGATSTMGEFHGVAMEAPTDGFPLFGNAVFPVGKTPNWGAMRTPEQWLRRAEEIPEGEWVDIPPYDLAILTKPLSDVLPAETPSEERIVTAKLFWSTRFFGGYSLDSGEYKARHSGVDIKLPPGTPVGAIGGGRVVEVSHEDGHLGTHVMVEHHLPNGDRIVSIYGHLESTAVQEGDAIVAGQLIGAVGNTGNSTQPHVHLQVDRILPGEHGTHIPYWPQRTPTAEEAAAFTLNPVWVIAEWQ